VEIRRALRCPQPGDLILADPEGFRDALLREFVRAVQFAERQVLG
jgi:hypothetical protein